MKTLLACWVLLVTILATSAQNVVNNTSDRGPGSLRQVIATAASGSTITFDSSLSGQTITLTGGELLLNQSLTIDGSALPNGVTISGNNSSRVFETGSGTTCVFTRLTMTNAFNSGLGGAILNGGTLTVNQCTIAASSAGGAGGGVFSNGGAATLNATTLSANSAPFGGGIANNGGPLTLNQCTLSGNSATGNANSSGGAISNGGGSATVTQCTISGNSVGGSTSHGGGIDNSGTLNLSNTIVANNTGPTNPNVAGAFTDNGGNFTSGNPVLAALGNNGGPTQTMLPQTGSPAIDGGNDAAAASFTYDQRGPGFPRILGTHVDIGAIETAGPATVVVMNNADSGNGSLRYAISHAIMGSTITFDSSLSGQTITLTSGELLLSQNLTIDASALASGITISGNSSSRVFETNGGTTCVLTRLAIINGFNSGLGGAILNAGTLTVNQCSIAASSAGTAGAGIFNNGGTLTLNGSTLSGNSSVFGGAMANNGGVVTLNQSTFSNNSVTGSNSAGGAISNGGGTVTLVQCTLSANSSGNHGGGIDSSGTLILSNTIVAANSATTNPNIAGSFTDNGGNLTSGNPALSALGNYGGPTQTMPPLAGSPAIDAGNDAAAPSFTYDQRGVGYPRSLGSHVDIGAVESNLPGNFVVLNNADSGSGSLRYALAHAIAGSTITFDASLSGQTITLTSGELLVSQNLTIDASALANGLTVSGNNSSRTFNVSSGTTCVLTSLIISHGTNSTTGGGGILNGGTLTLNQCTLSGNFTSNVAYGGAIYNSSGRTLTLNRCTLASNSTSGSGFAGAIYNDSTATLTLNQCTVSGNSATNGGGIFNNGGAATLNGTTLSGNSGLNGGGIVNNGGSLILNQCTLSGNSATGSANSGGGGISNGAGTLTLNQCTLSDNSAFGSNSAGGGISNGGTLTLAQCTVSGNSATGSTSSGGGIDNGGTLTVSNTIVANNTATTNPNLRGSFTDNGGNLTSGNPMLSALGNYGGPTQTMLLQKGSPAIDGGNDAAAANFTYDQRGPGYPRILGPHVDIGAVEFSVTDPTVTDNSDSSGASLRWAMDHATAGSTITLSASLSGQTITLTSGELLLNKNLTIDASALANGVTISGNSNTRVLEVASGVTCAFTALTISNGQNNMGGGVLNGGTLTLNRCTLSANSSPAYGSFGGAIYNGGTLTLNQCTVSGNSSLGSGGGIYSSGVALTVNQCTVSNNFGNLAGAGIFISSGTAALTNTIVAGNTGTPNISGTYTDGGGNLTSGNPGLAALGNYGGPTQTMPPVVGSSAIDGGNDAAAASFTYDQRGVGYARIFGPHVDVGAVEFPPLPVTTASDSIAGSLRYAVTYGAAGSTITFDPSLSGQTITLTGGELLLSRNTTIDASALANGLTISGNHSTRVFETYGGTACVLTAMTITAGNSGGNNIGGGGISNGGTLTLNRCTLSGNSAASGGGNGGAVVNTGFLTLNQCTLSGNSAASGSGGAIFNFDSSLLTLNQCTVSGNSSMASGGGISNGTSTPTLTNTIVAGNTASAGNPNISGTYTDNGGNLTSGNPMLSAFGNYGGPFQTMPPLSGSPAVNGGNDAAAASFTYDQRGAPYARIVGLHVDIGAVEANLPGDVVILNSTDSGAGSLRYALAHTTPGSSITFDATLSGQTVTLTSGELLLTQNVTIDASTLSHGLTISGNNSSRVFNSSGGTTCTLTALTIVNGTNSTTGGGVLNAGTLTLNQCTLSNNSVTGPAASYGGAVYNNTGGTLTLNQCTLSSNSAIGNVGSSGGALYNSGGGTLTLNQCTLSGNLAYFAGGGIFNNGGALALTNCTLSLNSATGNSNSRGGGISGGSLTLTNTIVAGNTAVTNANILANISGNGGNLTSGNPMLASLGNYGGRTQTMPPLIGSPAIDTGNDAAAASFTYDQRGAGYLRIVGPHVDIGAYERGSLNSFNAWAVETTGTAAGGLSFTGIAPNGRTYGLNYALRGNPLSGSASLLPALSPSGAGHSVQFPYRPGATDLIYTVQRSSDLTTWTEIYRFNPATNLVGVNGVTSSEDATGQIITINDPATGPRLFWRLSILQAP